MRQNYSNQITLNKSFFIAYLVSINRWLWIDLRIRFWWSVSAQHFGLSASWVNSVPSCHVMVVFGWHHHCSHDSSNVEVRPGEHLMQHCVNCEIVAVISHSLLHWDSSLVIDRLDVVSIIVGLNKEPSIIIELIVSMCSFGISFNNHSLVRPDSTNNVVNRCWNFFSSESLSCSSPGCFFFENSSHQPASRNCIVFDYTYQIFLQRFSLSCINIDGKSSMSDTSQSENTCCNWVWRVDKLSITIVVDCD